MVRLSSVELSWVELGKAGFRAGHRLGWVGLGKVGLGLVRLG